MTVIDTDIFNVNQWYLLEFSWTQGNSENMRIHIDGVFAYNLISFDLQAGSGGDFVIDIGNNAVGPIVFFKNLYHMYDATALIDELHFIITRAYRIGKGSVTPDSDLSGTPGAGQDLDAGSWEDTADGTAASPSRYDNNGDSGIVGCYTNDNDGVLGPKYDVHRDTEILAAKWMGEFNGGLTTGETDILLGNRTTEYIYVVNEVDTNNRRIHRFTVFLEKGDAGNRVPGTQDNIAIGFGSTAISGNISARELWAVVVYKTDVNGDLTSPPDPTVQINGGQINGGLIQ